MTRIMLTGMNIERRLKLSSIRFKQKIITSNSIETIYRMFNANIRMKYSFS